MALSILPVTSNTCTPHYIFGNGLMFLTDLIMNLRKTTKVFTILSTQE